MNNQPFIKNRKFYLGVVLTIIEGLLAGCNFFPLYIVMQMLWQNNVNMTNLLQITGSLALIYLLRLIIYGTGYTFSQIGGAEVSFKLRLYLGNKIKNIPLSRFTQGQTGQYINIVTSDVNNYEKVLTHTVGDIIKYISLSLMLIIFIGYIWLPGGIIMFFISLLEIPFMWLAFMIVKKYGHEKNDVSIKCVSNIVEYTTGIQTFRAYGIGGTKNKNVILTLKEYSDVSYSYEAHGIPLNAIQNICIWSSIPMMLWFAYQPAVNGAINMVAYLLIGMLPMFQSKLLDNLTRSLMSYKNLMISKGKILEIINEKEENQTNEVLEVDQFHISFDNVDFAYIENEPVLQNISFDIPDQKLTAIVGDSGSGKSTILNLISKYYEPNSGVIKIGGKSIHDISAEKVLEKISMVDQDVFLFDDTIRHNIRYARLDADDEEIEVACREANCHDFIMKMENGYDTLVGENGNHLSGGERQRLSIARAILKNSPILLLDEATASLDIENELAVKEAIANLLKNKKTVIMIAHTLSIIKNADKIVVVSNGKIVEEGTHETLLKKNGKYAAMWNAEQKLSI